MERHERRQLLAFTFQSAVQACALLVSMAPASGRHEGGDSMNYQRPVRRNVKWRFF